MTQCPFLKSKIPRLQATTSGTFPGWSTTDGPPLPVSTSSSTPVWITRYRKKLLEGDVGPRLRQIVRTICTELEAEILKGHISVDHVHLFVSCPPHVSPSYLMQRVKGKSSRQLMQQFSHLKRECWGRHLWARGFFVASSGNVTDEVIMEYIRTQEMTKEDDDFRVDEA